MTRQKNSIFFCHSLLIASLIIVQGEENETTTWPVQLTHDWDHQCPPWFFYNTATRRCECYRSPSTDDIVKCTEQGALLKYGYCMTHEEGEGTVVGRCQYFEIGGHNKSETPGFISLPDNVSELNDYMCGPMNRKGFVCSECIEGFGPSFTSLGYICSNCTDAWYAVPLFLFLEFVPISIFYFIVVAFQIGMTSAPFTAFVLYSHFGVGIVIVTLGPFSFETSPAVHYISALSLFMVSGI